MVSALNPRDVRQAAASAGLLTSDQVGERAAAAFQLSRILNKLGLDPAGVILAGLEAVSKPIKRQAAAHTSVRPASSPSRPLGERARMARYSPHLNGWEKDFLTGMMDRRRFSEREEAKLRDILRKSEGGEA